jgi:site-specific DNA recombinase
MYLRQSMDKDGNEIKVDTQRKDLTARLRARGATWDEFIDNDTSATSRMPGSKKKAKPRGGDYKQMIQYVKAGKAKTPGKRYDGIAVSKSDRLYREPRQLEDLIDLVEVDGLEMFTISSGTFDLATPEGRGIARLLCVMARMEMEQKSARHKREQTRMAEDDGRPWWPSRPFGFDADPDPVTGGWWTIRRHPTTKAIIAVNEIRKHPTEATLLKDAYRKFLAGSSTRSLAKFWNDKGVTTPRGNRWTGSAIHQLLAAARNAGLREYGGQLQEKKNSEGRVVGYVKGTWPHIVEPDMWESARRKLKDPSRRNGGTHARKHLLSGLLRCGVCTGPLAATVNSRGVRQYICQNDGCRKIARAAEKLDEMIIAAVVRRLSRPDAVDLLRPPIDPVDATTLREERRVLEDKLVQLGKDFATAPPEFTQAALADINGRLGEISDLLTDPGKARIFEDVIGAKDVAKAYASLDLGRRRTIVDALMTITVNPVGKVTGPKFDPDRIVNGKRAVDVTWKKDLCTTSAT